MRLSWSFIIEHSQEREHQRRMYVTVRPRETEDSPNEKKKHFDIEMSFFNLDRFRFQRDNAAGSHCKSSDGSNSDKENKRVSKKLPYPRRRFVQLL